MEVSYLGGGGYNSKHNIQLVFTSESFQLLMTFCCDLPEMKSISLNCSSQLSKRLGNHTLFQEVLSTCEACRETVQGICFLVSSNEDLFLATLGVIIIF